METKVDKIEYVDILDINKMLDGNLSIVAENPGREILAHINDGVALKLVKNGKIAGIACSMEYDEYTSLSYFYVKPESRGTWAVLDLFIAISCRVNQSKPVIIKTNDTTGFDKYVDKVGDNLYRFRGLR